MGTVEQVTLYLESWQKRMLKDFSRVKDLGKISKMTIKPGKVYCGVSYKFPAKGMRRDDWLIYLTDQQMVAVKEQLGLKTAIGSLNITAEAMDKGFIKFH